MTESEVKAKCYDCKRPYGDEHGFPDLVIPDWAWRAISPKGNGGGLLCPSCICKRLHEAGIENCPSQFTSGPLEIFKKPPCRRHFFGIVSEKPCKECGWTGKFVPKEKTNE